MTYLYCITQAPNAPDQRGIPRGLPGTERPRLLQVESGIWLVVTTLGAPEYSPAMLEARLKELDWVSRCAVGHERVVERFVRAFTTVPVRMFTLFSDDRSAVAAVRRNRDKLLGTLKRISGCQEWGFRVGLARRRKETENCARVVKLAAASGKEFLLRKQQNIIRRRAAESSARNCALVAYEQLSKAAAKACRRNRKEAAPDSSLLDAAFLVHQDQVAKFESALRVAVSELEKNGCDCVFSGPWPPYNFVGSI